MSKFLNVGLPTVLENHTEILNIDMDPSLVRTEAYLFANEAMLDEEKDNEIATEGVLSSLVNAIKSFFKKMIKAIIAIWKKLVAIAKQTWKWITSVINRIRGKKEKQTEVQKIDVVFVSEALNVKKQTVDNQKELMTAYLKATESINKEIEKRSKINIEDVKRFEKMTLKATLEAFSDIDLQGKEYLEEKVVYNNTLDKQFGDALKKAYDKLVEKNKVKDNENLRQHVSNLADYIDNQSAHRRSESVLMGKSVYDVTHPILLSDNRTDKLVTEIAKSQGDIVSLYGKLLVGEIEDAVTKIQQFNKLKSLKQEYFEIVNYLESGLAKNKDEEAAYTSKKEALLDQFDEVYNAYTNLLTAAADLGKAVMTLKDHYIDDESKHLLIQMFVLNSSHLPNFMDCPVEKRADEIKKWASLKVNYNKSLTSALMCMLKTNKAIFEISSETYAALEADVDEYTGDVYNYIAKLIFINDNLDQYFDPKTYTIDLRSIGLGIMIFGKESYKDFFADKCGNNPDITFDEAVKYFANYLLPDLVKWEVTLFIHGSEDRNETEKEKMDNIYNSYIYNSNYNDSKTTEIFDEDENGKLVIRNGEQERVWSMERVEYDGKYYIYLVPLLDYLINVKKFKRIKINNCNPGRIPLPKRFRDNKQVLIQMSTRNSRVYYI